MAETKRQSVNNRVATPKVNFQGPGDLDAALVKAVGARIKLNTIPPIKEVEGTILTACPTNNMILVTTATPTAGSSLMSTAGSFHFIPVSSIESFTILSPAETSTRESISAFSKQSLDVKALQAREQVAVRQMKEKDARQGKGVGREGQEIFDAIYRTLPTRWEGTTMIVNDAVRISKPYRTEDCTARQDQHNALIRVKKVLEAERKKIAARAGNNGIITPVDTARRGG